MDGQRAERLLSRARAEGAAVLSDLCRSAFQRLLSQKHPLLARRLFSDEERAALAEALAAINGTAELLGRTRILRRQELSEGRNGKTFAEGDEPFDRFDEGLALQAPEEAARYFQGLVPRLGVDPERYGRDQRRKAFTLAASTEETLLERVFRVLTQSLLGGQTTRSTATQVRDLLESAGVSSRNPQYAEMVARTNLMDAYNQGQQDQLAEVADYFPAWQYLGIRDGRQGKDHEPHFDQFYPSSLPFTEVRGDRVYNCRCTMRPVSREEWAELRARGVRFARAA